MADTEVGASEVTTERGYQSPSSSPRESSKSPSLDDHVLCILPKSPTSGQFITLKIPIADMPPPTLPYVWEFWRQATGFATEPEEVVLEGILYTKVIMSGAALTNLDCAGYKLLRVICAGPVNEDEEEASGTEYELIAFGESIYKNANLDPAFIEDDVLRVTTTPINFANFCLPPSQLLCPLPYQSAQEQATNVGYGNRYLPGPGDGQANGQAGGHAGGQAGGSAGIQAGNPAGGQAGGPSGGPSNMVVVAPVAPRPQRVFPPLAQETLVPALYYGFDLPPNLRAGVVFIEPTRTNPPNPVPGRSRTRWDPALSADLFVLLEIALLTCNRALALKDFRAITEALHRGNPNCTIRGWNTVHSYVFKTRIQHYEALQRRVIGF